MRRWSPPRFPKKIKSRRPTRSHARSLSCQPPSKFSRRFKVSVKMSFPPRRHILNPGASRGRRTSGPGSGSSGTRRSAAGNQPQLFSQSVSQWVGAGGVGAARVGISTSLCLSLSLSLCCCRSLHLPLMRRRHRTCCGSAISLAFLDVAPPTPPFFSFMADIIRMC